MKKVPSEYKPCVGGVDEHAAPKYLRPGSARTGTLGLKRNVGNVDPNRKSK